MDSRGKRKSEKQEGLCAAEDCERQASVKGFCRLHYIAHWKSLKENDQETAEKRLNDYVDRLAKRYPEDYIDRIREGLESDEKLKASLEELSDVDDDSETEREFLEKFKRDVKIDED